MGPRIVPRRCGLADIMPTYIGGIKTSAQQQKRRHKNDEPLHSTLTRLYLKHLNNNYYLDTAGHRADISFSRNRNSMTPAPEETKSSDVTLSSPMRRVSARKRKEAVDEFDSGVPENTKKKPSKPNKTGKAVKVKAESRKFSATATSRPTSEECYFVTEALSILHPDIVEENNKRRKALLISKQQLHQPKKKSKQIDTPVTDQIIGTMLSQNTTDANAHNAFATLKKDFPGGWDEVAAVEDITRIEKSIKVAGLAKTRAQRIQGMLQQIQQERGEANFEFLQEYESNDDIVQELSRFKGMGPKTISCVLLFALGRNDFPVDTHVLRITQQIGWVGKSDTRESAYEHFKDSIPRDCMMDLHCLLVRHGKVCYNCAANGRPQFPPQVGKAQWVCPLVGVKSGTYKLDMYGQGKPSVAVKLEHSAQATVKEEHNSSDQIHVKTEEMLSNSEVKLEDKNSTSNSNSGMIKPEESISGVVIKVEQM